MSILLIFAVLDFGGVDEWAIAILEIGSALLLLFWLWPRVCSGRLHLKPNSLYTPVVLFGLIIVIQVAFRLSAYVYVTHQVLWQYAAYGALFLLASQCQRVATSRLLTILGVFGSMVALFALIQNLTYNGKIYWFWPALPHSFGPYFNPNHYAGLMEMLTPIALCLALTGGVRRDQQLFWMLAGILMAATIFVSGSRGGMIAFAGQIVFVTTFLVARRNRRTAWALFSMCLVIGSCVFWIDDGSLSKKIDVVRDPLTNSDVTSRLTIARDCLRMVRDRPIAGWGLGLFPIVYPQYRSFSTDDIVNEAHNDYVQATVETGILGFACVLWFIVNLYRSGIRNLNRPRQVINAQAMGPLIGCTGILVHSFSDFNLQIPANAALFFVLCGIASRRDIPSRWD
jgi:O-antigen ligase